MSQLRVAGLVMCALAMLLAACNGEAVESDAEEVPAEASAGALSGGSLSLGGSGDVVRVGRPANVTVPWAQPESEGWFDEKGKCGQTATANLLRLYGREVSPQALYEQGVYSLIGSRGTVLKNYLTEEHPDLGCRIEHPTDGKDFLLTQLAAKRPIMVLYKTSATQSHWVTVVGRTQDFFGGRDAIVLMSWGNYYIVRLEAFDVAWRNVYGLRRPSIVCNKASSLLRPVWRKATKPHSTTTDAGAPRPPTTTADAGAPKPPTTADAGAPKPPTIADAGSPTTTPSPSADAGAPSTAPPAATDAGSAPSADPAPAPASEAEDDELGVDPSSAGAPSEEEEAREEEYSARERGDRADSSASSGCASSPWSPNGGGTAAIVAFAAALALRHRRRKDS